MKKEELLTYKLHITEAYIAAIGADWASSPEKRTFARKLLIQMVRKEHPNTAAIRHAEFVQLMIPAEPQTQYESDYSSQKVPRTYTRKEKGKQLNCDQEAWIIANEIQAIHATHLGNSYVSALKKIATKALKFYQKALQEAEKNEKGLPPEKHRQTMWNLLIF